MKLRLFCIVLCMLIISMPIAFAKELSITQLSGLAGVDGFYTFNDGVNITVRAALESEPNGIQADQVRLYIDGERNEIFDSCRQVSGSLYECRFDKLFGPYPGEHLYEVRLYSDDKKYDEIAAPELTKVRTFTLDMLPPDIISYHIEPAISSDGRIRLVYSVEDSAFDPGNTDICSGIDKVEFYLESDPTQPFVTVPGNGLCTQEQDYEFHMTGVPDGSKLITPRVYDKLGQFRVGEPYQVSLDTGGPSVNSSGIRIYDASGPINWMRTSDNKLVTIEIPVIDDNPNSVRADFTQLTDIAGNSDKAATRVEDHMAIWENVRLRNFRHCRITVRATDVFDHTTTKSVDCDVILDNEGPTVTSLRTDRPTEEEKFLFGVDTTVVAEITDTGSGVSAETISLDLREVTGEPARRADECLKTGGHYECRWLITATRREGLRQMQLTRTSTDRAGNVIKNTLPTGIEINLDVPEFGDYNIRVLPGQESAAPVLMKDTAFELSVNVLGHKLDEVYANLTSIGGEMELMQCSTESCTLLTEVPGSGPREVNITVVARNRAGNVARLPIPVVVYGVLDGEPNYWTPQVTCSPSRVDRRTASLVDAQVYCDLNLQHPNQNVQPVAVNFDGIVTCEEQAGQYIAQMSLLNTQGSRHPTMSLRLFDNDYPMEFISFKCPVTIYTSVRDAEGPKVHSLPEQENVTYTIGFYNQALGDLYGNLDRQVQDAVDEAKEYMSWVSKLNKFFNMASKFCDLKQTLGNIWSAVDTIKFIIGGAYMAAPPVVDGALQPANHALCRTENAVDRLFSSDKGGVWKFLNKMCVFVNCQATQNNKDFLSNIGGAGGPLGGICHNVKAFLSGIGDVGSIPPINAEERTTRYNAQFNQNFDVKNSLILSSMCLCVPGIIHNLNKMREIKCQKALCMKNEVRNNGLPPSVCEDLEGYLECNFIVGDIFNLFPIARLWTRVTDLLSTVIADPTQAITLYAGFACRGMCDPKFSATAFQACQWPKTMAKLGDAIIAMKGIKNIGKQFDMSPAAGACDQLEGTS